MPKLTLIALDGPSGVGKSSTAKRVAQRLGWQYLDTGAMYRCTALAMLRAGITLEDTGGLEKLLAGLKIEQRGSQFFLNGEDVSDAIRTPEVTKVVSPISAHPRLREVLVDQQRAIGKSGRWVVDGRDIGTVVFPEACCKIFLTASAEARAQRRHLELCAKGVSQSFDEILEDQLARDQADSTRAVAPLRKAEDSVELDSGDMSLEEVVDWVIQHHQRHSSQPNS